MTIEEILKDFEENELSIKEAAAAIERLHKCNLSVFSCEPGDVFRNRFNGGLVMVLREDEDHDIHFLKEDGESDYESIFNFEECFESEDRNIKEYWETFIKEMRGELIHSV